MRRQIDKSVLEMALVGYESERRKIEDAMAAIHNLLGVRSKGASASTVGVASKPTAEAKPKRKMSAAGKRAIRAALKKRWAEFHAKAKAEKPVKQTATKKAARKKAVSADVKQKRIAALAKARQAKAAKRAAQEPVPF